MNLDPLAILNALPEATLLRDGEGVVRLVNPAAERLLRVSAADVVGGHDMPHVLAEQMDSGEARFEIYTFEVPLSVEFLPVDGGGSLVVYRDRSWQRNLESYLAMMRFDLAPPLTPVRGFADIVRLNRGSITLEQQDEFLKMAAQGAARVRLELMFLHDWMWYENLDVPVYLSAFDLAEIMQEILEPLHQAYDFTEVQIDSDREPPPVHCDRGRMRFVLRALFRHVINLQDRQVHITFSIEDQHLVINCTIIHSSMPYRSDFAHLNLCRTLLEQQSGALEFTVTSDTTQCCVIKLPIAHEPTTS
jgi:signal transduction histidine kinase